MDPSAHLRQTAERAARQLDQTLAGGNAQQRLLTELGLKHAEALRGSAFGHAAEAAKDLPALAAGLAGPTAATALAGYLRDSAERWVLFLDVLRQRGNSYIEREKDGFKPVLIFDYTLVVDGKTLDRPVNYSLVRITPPDGCPPQREDGRPFLIIDPRAGHGSGIGGYKSDSEVGVALMDGHPVYFVIFEPDPQPEQTLADVCAAEAVFLEEVVKRHPGAAKPLVLGNCQGGWASMLLAATHPDLPGPVVIAGAPLSYWAGTPGRNPLRYFGGLMGGALPALLMADLTDGKFDGAHLVLNFESLNPANTWFRKYYDLFAQVDTEADRYLEFERWWSGFYFMNTAEIRWIIENLFIGNKLTRGQAVLDDGTPVDLRRIKSPIVVFASHGDNITPPEQALFWIADLYKTTREITARGQVIIYTLHETIGHLGIFVSSSVARKQHKQITSTVKTIEALAPGLYEMIITEGADRPHVSFEPRQIEDVVALGGDRGVEREFAPVARLSEWMTESYELTMRPFVRAMATPAMREAMVHLHPLRQRRYFFSDQNPVFAFWGGVADQIRQSRAPAAEDNPFRAWETAQAKLIEHGFNAFRDWRDASLEMAFHGLWGQPWVKELGKPDRQAPVTAADFRQFPEVRRAIDQAREGGYAEAVIRMLILMAHARGSVRRSRLERSNAILQSRPPFAEMSAAERGRLIHQQTLIVEFAPEEASLTLARLLPEADGRQRALDLVFEVAGPLEEMTPPTIAMFEQLQFLLGAQATGWQEPEYEIKPHQPGIEAPATADDTDPERAPQGPNANTEAAE